MCYSNNGENMKSDIIYSNDMLLVNLEGNMLKKDYQKLLKKIDYIVNEYAIDDIIIDAKSIRLEEEYLEELNNIVPPVPRSIIY